MNAWWRALARLVRGGERRGANPLLALYRWRWELALLALVVGLVWLGQETRAAVPLALVGTLAAVVAGWPPAWRAVRDRGRAVFVQHRLRSAFRELGLTTWAGRGPAIAWTSARHGLRVHLLCPAGIGVSELAEVREQLAAACWAADVLVERHPRHANLVVLVVVTQVAAGGP